MANSENEEKWRKEFNAAGETETRYAMGSGLIIDESKRQFASRWLREQDKASELRERQMYRYVRLTFYAAVAAVIVGILGVVITSIR